MVKTRIRDGTNLLDPHGFGRHAVQLFGNRRQLDGGAISSAYYPEGRDVSSAVSKLGSQIGVDMAGNILKEFWPDLRRKFSRDRKAPGSEPAPTDKH